MSFNKVLAIHDLSCHGASSLNVVMPVLYAAGVDLSILPCALLSTQSDGFGNLYTHSLEDDCQAILDRWSGYRLFFDGLYSGYLAHEGQLELVMRARRDFLTDDALIVTDPVMGDDGVLYQNLGSGHVDLMKALVPGSAVITPNATEACLLLGRSQIDGAVDRHEAEDMARSLCALGCASAVITSLPLKGEVIANVAWDGKECRIFPFERVEASYPGSGDLFASLMVAHLHQNDSFFVSVMKATRFTSHALRQSLRSGRERREGVCVHHAISAMLEEGSWVL